jgi:S1-C subfamily serine protease
MNSSVVKLHTQHICYDTFAPFQIVDHSESSGTAFFFDKNLLLTCHHCVENLIKLFISAPNVSKKQYSTDVIAIIPELDIAFLKCDEFDIEHTILELGDSDSVKPLDQVIALGFPMDSDSLKYTKGIISGKQYEFLQTDASINPGNSGGPLLFEDKVIGINSHKIANAENMGFSVPINFFKKWYSYILLEQTKGSNPVIIRLPSIDLFYSTMNETGIEYLNNKHKDQIQSGILVTQSINGMFQGGDLISKINGDLIDNFGSIKWGDATVSIGKYLINFIVGDNILFEGIREGKVFTTTLEIENKQSLASNSVYTPFEHHQYVVIGGMVIMELTSNHSDLVKTESMRDICKINLKLAEKTKLQKTFFISRILNGSKIISLDNVDNGDIILSINNKELSSFEDVVDAIKTPQDDHLILYLNTDSVFIYPYDELRKIDTELMETYDYKILY